MVLKKEIQEWQQSNFLKEDAEWVYLTLSFPLMRTINVSKSVEKVLGYRREDFMHNPGLLMEIIIPDDLYKLSENLENLLFEGKSKISLRVIGKYDQLRCIRLTSILPEKNPNDDQTIKVLLRDKTPEKPHCKEDSSLKTGIQAGEGSTNCLNLPLEVKEFFPLRSSSMKIYLIAQKS